MQTAFETKITATTPKQIALPEPEQSGLELIPLSFAQQRLWFFSQLERNSALYNIPTAIRLTGELDVVALKKSLNIIVQRHEALRTNFISNAGNPVQIIRPEAKVEISISDLSGHPEEQREEKSRALVVAESQKPFDLTGDLLLRASLVRVDSREHILVLNMHHIVSDEWSLRVLFQELSALYQNFIGGSSSSLPELPIQYADYALWQRECLRDEIVEREVSYWKNQLGNNFAPLELPADRARPAIQTYNGASCSISLSKENLNFLNDLSRREGVTLFMSLLAAFKALLHRYTGQEQITIGSPISGRNKIETENLIGFFVNTLVLRTNVSGELSFCELLARIREVTLGAYAHQDLPFEKLIEELQPHRDAGNLSFIEVMFALQNSSENDLKLPRLQVKFLEIESRTSKFDLTFVVRESAEDLTLVAEYNTDLFEGETIERLLWQYGRLLEAVVENPEQKISRLNILSKIERQQVVMDWNKTETAYPLDKCIPELFEAQVEKTPDAIALVFGEQQLTYGQLNERANQLAHHLRECGVGPDSLVGLCLDRSLELIVGLLAILKAGGAYVPLDANYPRERLAFMMEDTNVSVLITDKDFSFAKARQIDPRSFPAQSPENLVSKVAPENLAYVIYTSGSTGKPKGVAVPHRGVVRLVRETNFMQFSAQDVFLQFAPVSFDASTLEIWGSLLNGAKLVIHPPGLPSLEELGQTVRENKVTTLWLTAGLFHQMVEHQIESLRGVKQLLAGGDVLSVPHVKKVLQQLPDCQLINGYGPTENTTFTCCYSVPKNWRGGNSVPIGKPIANTQVYILDQHLKPTPIGVPGELFIGGDGLARGYLNAPELNAEKFIPNPFKANERLYKTGDKVRYRADGNIEFLGRIDHQLKIRGYRIEPQEIEAVLKQHRAIKDALVLALEQKEDKRLVAYLIASKNAAPKNDDLRAFLKQKLPDYMVPSIFVFLDEFPLTANGKVDRSKLPAPQMECAAVEESRSMPLTFLEMKLKEIWEEVIGRKPIGVRENFFDLGGHSLLAVRLFTRIEKVLGKKLSLALLFQSPTIEQLANAISGNVSSAPDSCLIEIQPNGSRPPIFWLHTLGGGGGGGVLRYQKLAQLLGPDQPSYGLVAPPEPFTQMEAMAAHYIQEMRTVQPVGPYHLSGYCFGGVVAFEIAQQLRAAGEEIGLLAVLDSSPANVADARTLSSNALHLFTSLPKRMERFFHQEPSQIFAGLKRKSKQLERMLFALVRHDHATAPRNKIELGEVIDLSHYPKGYKRYAEIHWEALLNYFPKVYSGKIVFFETTKSPENLTVESIWKSLAIGGVEVKRIPCKHEQMLDDPYVRIVAAGLTECLEDCRKYERPLCKPLDRVAAFERGVV